MDHRPRAPALGHDCGRIVLEGKRRLGRSDEARAAYDAAIAATENEAERGYLGRRRDQLGS